MQCSILAIGALALWASEQICLESPIKIETDVTQYYFRVAEKPLGSSFWDKVWMLALSYTSNIWRLEQTMFNDNATKSTKRYCQDFMLDN